MALCILLPVGPFYPVEYLMLKENKSGYLLTIKLCPAARRDHQWFFQRWIIGLCYKDYYLTIGWSSYNVIRFVILYVLTQGYQVPSHSYSMEIAIFVDDVCSAVSYFRPIWNDSQGLNRAKYDFRAYSFYRLYPSDSHGNAIRIDLWRPLNRYLKKNPRRQYQNCSANLNARKQALRRLIHTACHPILNV